jgi:5-methylthioadenosine/S-adenosylhomocysteine deaminase
MTTRRTLIESALVLVEGQGFADVSLLLADGRILDILDGPGPEDAERFDAANRLIIPGLVNAHTHSHGALGRGGVEDRATLEMFLAGAPALNGGRTAHDLYLSAALSAVELIRKGCTACFDLTVELPGVTVDGLHAVGQAYVDAGIRAVVAPMVADRTLYQALPGLLEAFDEPLRSELARITLPPFDETLATCTEAFRSWPHPLDRVRPGLGPTIPLHCSDPFLAACGRLATDFDLKVQTHLAETKTQAQLARQRYGTGMVDHLDKLGLLSPRLSAAHGIWLDRPEMSRLARRGVSVAHNPMSNLRLGSGIAATTTMAEAGVVLGVGTDASNTSDGQNMFEALRLAATLGRVRSFDPADWLSSDAAFAMATTGSARILGFPDIGRIAKGAAADLVFLDRGYCHYAPLRQPLRQIVFAETGAAVREVMVSGKFVFQNDRVLTLDEAALGRAAAAAALRLDAANAPARQAATAAAATIQSFCLGQCRARPWLGRMVAEEDA